MYLTVLLLGESLSIACYIYIVNRLVLLLWQFFFFSTLATMQWCGSFTPNERNYAANKTKQNERSKRKGIYHCHTARKIYMFPSCLSLTTQKNYHSIVPNAKRYISIQRENVFWKYCLRSTTDYIKVLYSVKKRLFHVYLHVPRLILSSKNQRDLYDLGKTIWKLILPFISYPEEAKY